MIIIKALFNKQTVILHKTNDRVSEHVDEHLYGYEVEVLETFDNDFVRIKTHYNYEGYVETSNLIFDDLKIKEFQKSKLMRINHFAVDVRSLPKVQGVTLITLTKGCLVTVFENIDGWVKTVLIDGTVGYIKEKFLEDIVKPFSIENASKDEIVDFRNNVVETAKQYKTTQYKWGGKSPLGIDCSGLTQMAYMLNGVLIYRDAKIVESFPVKEISIENIEIGDLIYFPGHIGLYIGNNEYIHSSAGNDGVYINSLDKNSENYRGDLATTITACGSIF